MWLQATSSAGLGLFCRKKMNHAMENNSLKISAASSKAKTPLDSNGKNIFAKFQLPLTGSIIMKKTSMHTLPTRLLFAALAALLALAPHALANGFPTNYWLGSNGTLWTAGDNWSSTSNGTTPASFSPNNYIVFSANTTTSNETSTDLDGDQTISSLTINTTGSVPVGISGGNLTINGTTTQAITVEAGNLTISSPLILTGSATTITANQSTSIATITAANGLVFDGTSSASIGAITANGSLQKLGSGTTTLTGNNTYTGNTTISDGTLALSANGTLGNSTVSISGGLLDMGGKSLTNTLGTLTGGEIANGTLTNNGSSFNLQNGTVSATLAGTNGVNKTTSGTVILSGSNTYNGTTSINAGTLQTGSPAGLGSGGNITFGGGTLQYGSGITADVSSRIKNSGSAIAIDTNSNNVTFSGSMNATNTGGLTKLGNGTLSLNGNNTYTGGTFIESGTLSGNSLGLKGDISNNATLLLSGGSIVIEVDGSGVLLVDGSTRLLGNATMNGGTTIQSGTLTIGGRASNSSPYIAGSIPGDITNNGRLDFDLSPSSGIRTYAGVISGNGSLGTSAYDSSPTGTISLIGNNTYTGGTFVSVGTLDISGGSLASSGNVTITGGSFNIGASNQTIGGFQINGTQSTSAVGSGTLTATNGYDLRQGTVSLSLAGAADIYKNSKTSTNNSYDNGIAYLSANNTAFGNITISGGILSFNTVQSLYSGNNSTWTPDRISVGANSTLALGTGNGSAASGFNNDQIAEIFKNLTESGTGGLAANSKIGFNTTSIFTLTTNITDRPDGGAIGVDKIGASTLTLNSTNTFTGALSIFEGVVALGRTNALLPDSDLVVDSKSSSSYGFDVGIYNQQFKDVTLKEGLIAGSSGSVIATGNYTMIKGNATANLSGNASLTKTNTSGSSYNVSEPEIVFLSGINSYTGNTTVQGVAWTGSKYSPSSDPGAPSSQNAKLQFQNVGSLYSGNETLWTPANIIVKDYGILSLRTGTAGFNATQVSTIIQKLITANRSDTGGGFLANSMLGIDTNGEDLVINNDIGDTADLATGGGAVGLIKYGAGTLTLNGNSTRSFSTSVTGGNLVLGSSATLSSASANLLVDGALLDISTTNQTVRKVTVTNGSIIGSGTLTSSASGFVFGSANVTANLAGAVGADIYSSSGTTILWGNNTYTGNTNLYSSATLNLANVNALSASTLVHSNSNSSLGFSLDGANTYYLGGLAGIGSLVDIDFTNNTLSIGANNQNTDYYGTLTGSGLIEKVGNGTLTLSNNNTYTGGTTISAGTLALGIGSTSGSVDGDITNNANLVFNRSNNATYADIISGTGNVTKAGSGTLTLSGANSYTGITTINTGTLALGANQTLGAITGGGSLFLDSYSLSTTNAVETTFSGVISGTGEIIKSGSGAFILTGSNTYTGDTTISSGTLSIGNGGTTGSVTGNITNNAALAFNRSNNSTYSGIISGTGTLEKLGNGTLTLTGNNSANGAITITAGTLQLGNGTNSGSVAGAITNNGALAINRSDALTFNYSMNGTGSVVKLGNNTLTYNSTVTPTGGTFVNAGTLVVSGSTSAVTVNANGTLAGNGTVGNVVINSGGTIAPGNSPGNLTAGNMTWNGGGIYNWQLGSANGTAGTDWDLISSTGSLSIGANSTNKFIIAASTNNSTNGFDPNAQRASWKIAEFGGGITGFASNSFNITTSGFGLLPSVHIFYVSQEGNALNFNYATMATWNTGNGTWSNAANWVGGARPVDGVSVEYASPSGTGGLSTYDNTGGYSVADIYSLQFSSGHNHAYTIAGGNLTIGEGGIVNNSNSTQTIALNLTLGANQTFAANTANLLVSGNISGNASLTKAGNQTLTLSGSNSYNGGTTINSGTLLLESTGQISHSGAGFYVGGEDGNAAVILNGGSISNFDSYIGFGNGSTGTVNMNSGNWTNGENLRVGYYGNGTLNLSGGSISNVNGVIGRYGASNGVANVSGGTWFSSGNFRIGDEGTGTLNLTGGNVVVASGSGNVTIGLNATSSGTLNIGTGTTVGTLQAARVTGGNGTAIVNFNHTVASHTFSPILAGNLTVNKLGNGTTALTGNNSYTQGTVITAGTLAAESTSALGTGHVDLNNNGVLAIGGFASGLANMTLSVGGNFSWSSNSSTIALLNGASANITGSLSSNGVVGNRTFDVSQYGVVSNNTITLAYLGNNATDIMTSGNSTANATFDISFTSLSQSSTVLTTGNFVIEGNLLKYVISSAIANGSSLDIRNSDADFIVNTPTTAGTTVVTGQNPLVKDVVFQGSNNLVVPTGVALTVFGQEGTAAGQLDVQNGTSSILSGSGTIEAPNGLDKVGGGELDLQSNTNVTGIATVVEGLLSVNGQLATTGGVVVDPGATLGGAGFIIGNVVVNGNLSPGNSPGTLNVIGNLVLTGANSTIIEIASPTNFDRIVVSGTATLGGTLNAVAYGGGTITPGARYDFLQAGSIDGEFDSLIAPDGLRIRFLNSGTVGTLLFGPGSYVMMAINQNQRNVAKALDTFIVATDGDRLAVSIALDSLTTEQFPAAFDQIMPGFYESLANIAIEQAFAQTQMLNQRISAVRLGAAGFQAIGGITQPLVHDKNGKSAADAKDASPIVESATATNWNAWALGTGMFSRSTDLGRLQNYNNDAGGFLVGADYRWSENFVTGLYGGYDYSYAEYNGGGSTKGNSFSFGTYASYAKDGYYADAVIGGGYTGFQTQRSIEFSTIDRTASADPNSAQFTAGINLGKDFEVGKFTLGPIIGAQYTYAGIGSFTESGAESLDLSLGQQNANSLRSTLGGRVAYTWNLNQKIALIPEVRMFWQHEFLNNARNINASLDGGNGASFDYETTDPYRNSVFAGAGVTAQFGKNLSGSVFYNINFGSQTYQNNMVSAGLNFSF
jgi:autotransporter-associated beta strand protein